MKGDRWGRESKYVVYVSRKVRVVFIVETGRKNDWMDRKECSGKRVYKKKNGQERERRGGGACPKYTRGGRPQRISSEREARCVRLSFSICTASL